MPEICRVSWRNNILDTWCILLVIYTKIITMHGHLNIKDEICWTSSVHRRERLRVVILVGKPRKGTKSKQIKTVQNGLNGSEMHTVVAFCEHDNELAGFGNGARFYEYRNYCQLQNKDWNDAHSKLQLVSETTVAFVQLQRVWSTFAQYAINKKLMEQSPC